MGEFFEAASHLSELLEDFSRERHKGIKAEDIHDLVGGCVGGEVNCYPGIPGYGCCSVAWFISLSSPVYVNSRQKKEHLSCKQAMSELVRHMQGSCVKITRHAVLLTDNWDASAYEYWKNNFREIVKDAHLEVYLKTGREVNLIKLP